MAQILVPVKAVPLGAPVVALGEAGSWVEPPEHRLDPVNEVTVEWAVRQLEAGRVSGVTAVSVGGGFAETALRGALARGCTEALRIAPEPGVQVDLATSAALLAAAARRAPALVVAFGYESYDASSGALPAATAGELGWALVSRARDVTLDAGAFEATRLVGDGSEVVRCAVPGVVSFVEGGVLPRNPRIAAVIAARKAEIPEIRAAELLAGRTTGSWVAGLREVEAVPRRAREARILDASDGVRELVASVQAARENPS